jgi:hypothetical protein
MTDLQTLLGEFAESFSQGRGASAKEHLIFFGEKMLEALDNAKEAATFAAVGAVVGVATKTIDWIVDVGINSLGFLPSTCR